MTDWTITHYRVRAALSHLRLGADAASDVGQYLLGGVDALLVLLPGVSDEPDSRQLADAVRFTEDHTACRMCCRVFHIDAIRSCESGEPICDECWPGLVTETEAARVKWDALDAGPPPTLAQEEAQPAHAAAPSSADPPIAIPPLPAGPEDARPSAPTEAPPAAEAAARPLAPAPAPPPALAPEGISPSSEVGHAPPDKVRAPALMHPTREAAFRAAWPDRTLTNAAIRARLNKTPGREIKHDQALYRIAASLDLPRRSDLFTRSPASAEALAASPDTTSPAVPAEAEPEAAATPDPVRRPASLGADDMAEGDRNIRAGWSPLQLVEWFGITEAEAKTWWASLYAAEGLATPTPESVGATAADTAQESEPEAEDAAAETTETEAPAPAEAISAPVALSFPADPQGREVWEAFDSGMSVRDVGADFGIPLSTLTNTYAQWQLARRKELAA